MYVRDRETTMEMSTCFAQMNTVISPTGRFCCEVEDATGTNQIHVCHYCL